MPHINEMTQPSKKYINKDDIGKGALFTIKGVEKRNVAKEGDAPELKWLLLFNEASKPFVLNSTNIQLTARACESEVTEEWIGRQVVLYFDPNVSYAGKLVGGIRIRAPKPQAVPLAGQIPNPMADNQRSLKAQQQTIAKAAAKWTQGHAMPAAVPVPEPVEDPLDAADIDF